MICNIQSRSPVSTGDGDRAMCSVPTSEVNQLHRIGGPGNSVARNDGKCIDFCIPKCTTRQTSHLGYRHPAQEPLPKWQKMMPIDKTSGEDHGQLTVCSQKPQVMGEEHCLRTLSDMGRPICRHVNALQPIVCCGQRHILERWITKCNVSMINPLHQLFGHSRLQKVCANLFGSRKHAFQPGHGHPINIQKPEIDTAPPADCCTCQAPVPGPYIDNGARRRCPDF